MRVYRSAYRSAYRACKQAGWWRRGTNRAARLTRADTTCDETMLAWQASLRAGRRGARRRGIGRRGLGRRGARRGGPGGGCGGTWIGVASTMAGERMEVASYRKIPTGCELTDQKFRSMQINYPKRRLSRRQRCRPTHSRRPLMTHTRPFKFGEEQRTRSPVCGFSTLRINTRI